MSKELKPCPFCGHKPTWQLTKIICNPPKENEMKTFREWKEEAIKDESIVKHHRNSLRYYSSQELELWEIIFEGGKALNNSHEPKNETVEQWEKRL